MIFTPEHAQMALDGRKRQTRRPVKPGDMASHNEHGGIVAVLRNGRLLWRVSRVYALQPGRGKKAIGRIRITKIRRERLWEITANDCLAEGIRLRPNAFGSIRWDFKRLWNSIYRKPYRWEDNPWVWCFTFELVRESRRDGLKAREGGWL